MFTEELKSTKFRSLFFVTIAVTLFLLGNHLYNKKPSHHGLIKEGTAVKTSGTFKAPLDIVYVEENLENLRQNDPQLIQYTRIKYLTPPSKQPYNLERRGNFRDSFSGWIADYFKNKRDGIFIEAGANKGDLGSHTLYLEKELGWNGLLIECNPLVVPYLKTKHRKAWIAEVCLSPTKTPKKLNFSNPVSWSYSGTLGKAWNLPVPTNWTYFEVQTIPLYTVLAALGWKEVDYFSFDIEGQELNVLNNFPFDMFTFKVLIIEVHFYTAKEKSNLDQLLKSKGYVFVRNMEIDKIYVHKKFRAMLSRERNF